MRSEIQVITPEKARQILAGAPENVRKLNMNRVQQYARDMKAGKWVLHHQGLAYDKDGRFFDGYHRLNAVIIADVPVEMYVTYGVPESGKTEVDGITVRPLGAAIGRTAREASIARMFKQLPIGTVRVFSRQELESICEAYSDGISFAVKHCQGIRVAVAVLAARSFYYFPIGEQKARLAIFFDIIHDMKGNIDDLSEADSAAGEFRKKIRNMKHSTGQAADVMVYQYGQSALLAFMDKKPIVKFFRTEADKFPVPSVG